MNCVAKAALFQDCKRRAASQTVSMELHKAWQRWMRRWRVERRPPPVPALPDPADCGTAWGLELTIPKVPARKEVRPR